MKILHQCLPTNESVFVGHAPPFKIIENIKILGKYEASFLTFLFLFRIKAFLKFSKITAQDTPNIFQDRLHGVGGISFQPWVTSPYV